MRDTTGRKYKTRESWEILSGQLGPENISNREAETEQFRQRGAFADRRKITNELTRPRGNDSAGKDSKRLSKQIKGKKNGKPEKGKRISQKGRKSTKTRQNKRGERH